MYDHTTRIKSDYLFEYKVHPAICKHMPHLDGIAKNVNDLIESDKKLLALDAYNGADFAIINKDKPIVLLSTRVQTNVDFRSFTITYQKENGQKSAFQKLKDSIEAGCYPKYTIQAFTKSTKELSDDDDIDEIGIIETTKLIQLIDRPPILEIVNRQTKRDGSERFYYINFDDIQNFKISFVRIHL
jgi:hypothetical protein